MIVLHILLWIFLILLGLILLIIFVPICYHVEGRYGQEKQVEARVHWLFFVRFIYKDSIPQLKIGPYKLPMSFLDNLEKDEEKDEEEPPPTKGKSMGFKEIKSLLTKLDIKSIISLGIMLLKKLWKKIKPKRLYIKGTVGFADPCTTGQFLGLYEACAHTLGFRSSVDLTGDFNEKRLELDMKLAGGFAVASLAWPVIWFIFQKPVRDGIKLMKEGRSNE